MQILPSSLLDSLSEGSGLWPGKLEGEWEPARRRLEHVLGQLPDDVRAEIVEALRDPPRNVWARSAVHALALAEGEGARPVGVAAPGCLAMVSASGASFGLGVLGFTVEEDPSGAPGDVKRLTDALDGTFSNRCYVLYLRRGVPPDFDPAPISRAVNLWLGAIDRGEWQGKHAVYEDKDVALELILTGETARVGRSTRVFTVGPITALERLAAVDTQLVKQVTTYQEVLGDLPLICALGATRPWRMPRGYVEQLLYGTADQVATTWDGVTSSYEAWFRPNGRSLFSDPACRNLASLWWMEPKGPDPMAFRAWTHLNPWCDQLELVPTPRVSRFERVDDASGGVAHLRWSRVGAGGMP